MSLSKPAERSAKNPATKYIEWKGAEDQGYFQYYDKEIEDKEKRNVVVDLSNGFIVLDGLDSKIFSITGYDEREKVNIISNEVREMSDILHVRKYIDKKAVTIFKASYNDLKEQVSGSRTYKYTACFYIFFEGELCHLKLSGAPLRQWFTDVQPNMNAASSWISVKSIEDGIQGKVKYKYPIWQVNGKIEGDDLDNAIECDEKILQPYLKEYFKRGGSAPQGDDPQSNKEEQDTSKWRTQVSASGKRLCELNHSELIDLQEHLIEDGDTKLIDYVGHALYDYQQASQTWQDQKSVAMNKTLGEFTLEEVQDALAKINPSHPAKILLDCAFDFKNKSQTHNPGPSDDTWEEDDIPF